MIEIDNEETFNTLKRISAKQSACFTVLGGRIYKAHPSLMLKLYSCATYIFDTKKTHKLALDIVATLPLGNVHLNEMIDDLVKTYNVNIEKINNNYYRMSIPYNTLEKLCTLFSIEGEPICYI